MCFSRFIAAILLLLIIISQAIFSILMISGSVVVKDHITHNLFDAFGTIDPTMKGPAQ